MSIKSPSRDEINWSDIRIPGVSNPALKGPWRFMLPPGLAPNNRPVAYFNASVKLNQSSLLCFTLHSPTSTAMFPDIVRGDFGFPTLFLKNSLGTYYHFARGNLKDFFCIQRPNEPQFIQIPLSAFVYSREIKTNIPDNGCFFDQPISQLSFDFLAHPKEQIDICIEGICFETGHAVKPQSTDLISIERVGQARQLPALSSEIAGMSLGISLNSLGISLGLSNGQAAISLHRRSQVIQSLNVAIAPEAKYVGLKLPFLGHYKLNIEIGKDGESVAHSSLAVCRMLPRLKGPLTILGISDGCCYNEIAAVGGSWDRLPISLLGMKKKNNTYIFDHGVNPLPPSPPSRGRHRIIAPFAMPKWLSHKPDQGDYHCYGASNWKEYEKLVAALLNEALDSGVTHYEVWNEASSTGSWKDDMASLIQLHQVTYETVKSIAPELVVLGGCTHSWTFDFLRSFFSAGGANYCDGLAVHGYTYQPHDFLKQFDELDNIIHEFCKDRPDFRSHITEIGFRHPTFSLDEQALYMALYALEAASRQTVAAMLYFRFVNTRPELMGTYRQNASAGYAMVGYQGLYCRPSIATFRFIERLLQYFDAVSASGPGHKRRYEFLKNGKIEAVAIFQNKGEVELPSGWIELDHYGERAQEVDLCILRFALSPQTHQQLF